MTLWYSKVWHARNVLRGEIMNKMQQFERFNYTLMIKEHHLDTFGHVNNATYLELFEEARWDFVTARGFGLDYIHQMKMGPVVLACHIKFIKELRLRQCITIESQTLHYERKIGSLIQRIFNEQQELCCEATMTFGLFDMVNRKLMTPTPEWFKAMGKV